MSNEKTLAKLLSNLSSQVLILPTLSKVEQNIKCNSISAEILAISKHLGETQSVKNEIEKESTSKWDVLLEVFPTKPVSKGKLWGQRSGGEMQAKASEYGLPSGNGQNGKAGKFTSALNRWIDEGKVIHEGGKYCLA